MTDEGRAEVATLLDNWGPKWCPAANTTDCGLECEAIGVAMNESCTDGKVACHGLCPNYGAAESCWNCQNKIDKRYDNPQNALGFYCTDSCGAECGWVGDTYAQRCMGLADPKECVLCNGADARPTLDRCNKCVPGSRLYPEQKATVMASLAQVYAMCQETKVPVGCEKECKILETYTELCEGLDPQKCAGMCKVSTIAWVRPKPNTSSPDHIAVLMAGSQPSGDGVVQHLCAQQRECVLCRYQGLDSRERCLRGEVVRGSNQHYNTRAANVGRASQRVRVCPGPQPEGRQGCGGQGEQEPAAAQHHVASA